MKNILAISILLAMNWAICHSQDCSRIWTSDSLFLKPESALYDSTNEIIYISNINDKYLAKDGNGFISKIKTNGELESLKWVEGLDNPQGMGL